MPDVKPIPEGFHAVTPYLTVQGANKLIDFLKQAFGATEEHSMKTPDGKIMHADVKIGDSHIMIGEAMGEWKAMPTSLYLYVKDVDATYKRAVEAGGKSLMEVDNQFYGDRQGAVVDPCGNQWMIATRVENLSQDEIKRRGDAWMEEWQSGQARSKLKKTA